MVKTRAAPKKRVELAIHRAVCQWLRDIYPHIKFQSTFNELNRHQIELCDLGITDLILFDRRDDGNLHVFFLELKPSDGDLIPSQITWAADYHDRFASHNTHYAVARGFLSAQEAIISWVNEDFTLL